jgi:hypothetical protein
MRTDSSMPSPPGAKYVTDAVQTRDDGLRLATRVQRWIAVLAVGTATGLAALTAHAYHARAAAAKVARPTPAAQPTGGSASSGSTVPATPIQPPASAPAPAASASAAPVVSGGS